MLLQMNVTLKNCSYQFLSEVALFVRDPKVLASIYNTIMRFPLRPTDCDTGSCGIGDLDCTIEGVLEALAQNKYTSKETMEKISKSEDFCIRAKVAKNTIYDEVIDLLLQDDYLMVISAAMNNPIFTQKHYNTIFNRLINSDFDFDMYDNFDYTRKADFVEKVINNKFATELQIEMLKDWLSKQ